MIDRSLPLPPLLGELHVHLLGTGDTEFWLSQLRRMEPATVLLPAPANSPSVSVASLIDDVPTVRSLLFMEPGEATVDFGRFAGFFRLRQAIAGPRPEALADLIVWNASRYCEEGVRHVEFSIGVSWVDGDHATALRRGIDQAWCIHGVHVGLLLGFDRTSTAAAVRGEAVLSALLDRMDEKLGLLRDPAHYAPHLKELDRVRLQIETHGLGDAVLGLDLTGDERFAPYAPFLLAPFLEFVQEQRRGNHRFGVRLHSGELAMPNNASGYVALRVTEALLEGCWRANIPTRVGHGVGVALLDAELGERFTGLYGPQLATHAQQACRETLRTATIEICLTSNRRLVGHAAHENPVRTLLADDSFHCVLATDDPNIFAERGSLSDEFVQAIDAGLLTRISQVDRLVAESIEGSFAPPHVVDALNLGISFQPAVQEPPEEALALVRRLLTMQRPERAAKRVLALQSVYRRSISLWNLRQEACQVLSEHLSQDRRGS